jgi:hypothetical protein
MHDIAAQLQRRDHDRRNLALRKTYAERMAEFYKLHERMRATMHANPEAYSHFPRRNYKAQAIHVQTRFVAQGPVVDGNGHLRFAGTRRKCSDQGRASASSKTKSQDLIATDKKTDGHRYGNRPKA